MDILAEWLTTNESVQDVGSMIDRLSSEIEILESQIRSQLKLKDGERYPYIFKDFSRFLGDTNVKILDIDARFSSIEEDTYQKTKDLRDSLVRKQELIDESLARKAVAKEREQELDVDESADPQLFESLNAELLPGEVAAQYQSLDKLAIKYLVEARALIKADLFPTVDVGSAKTHSPPTDLSSEQNIFSFPACKVSKFIYEFVQLLFQILSDASQKSGEERYSLFQAARNVCELYLISLQAYHGKMISEYHQYCAVNHNNCLFVAHNLMVLPGTYKLKNENACVATFVDMIPALKEAAYGCITHRMKKDNQTISGFFRCPEVTEAFNSNYPQNKCSKSLAPFEKAIKQSITHIASIRTAWIQLLPTTVCNKLVATLINWLISEMIHVIVRLEDIPADTATSLENIFEQLSKDVENLTKDFPLQYTAVIPKWLQFQELRTILQASLKDIVDRWADGHGPLAEAFTAENVKSLIRSLFQNTDRRSAALAQIR